MEPLLWRYKGQPIYFRESRTSLFSYNYIQITGKFKNTEFIFLRLTITVKQYHERASTFDAVTFFCRKVALQL
jgi:hypothetical protein